MAESNKKDVVKEGFICPSCHEDLRSPNSLLIHFQNLHSEEQDLLKSLKHLVGKAKKKILNLDEKDIELFRTEYTVKKYSPGENEPQEEGLSRLHTDYFMSIRRERLEHRTTETNRLILRLDKLLKLQGTDRKQQEQKLITWLDGSTVTRCPTCTSSFNITKRQHHCRLCGSIMCHSCSQFLLYETASTIVASNYSETNSALPSHKSDSDTLRICDHCMNMLECKRNTQMRQMVQYPITALYEQLQEIKSRINFSLDLYLKMCTSLTSGDTTFPLQDAQSLKSAIVKKAEALDALSKTIAAIPLDPKTPRIYSLQNAVRRAIAQYVKDYILTLPVLPSHSQLQDIKTGRLRNYKVLGKIPEIQKVAVTTGWSPANVSSGTELETTADPLIEQMNIVRNYIEQARKAQRFEEVQSLQENLKMLKNTYQMQIHSRDEE